MIKLVKLADVKVGTKVVMAVSNQLRVGTVLKQTFRRGWSYGNFAIYTSVGFNGSGWLVPFMHSNKKEVMVIEDETPVAGTSAPVVPARAA